MSTLRDNLKGVPQDEEFHPEGDVWTHTRAVRRSLDEAMRMTNVMLTEEQRNLLRVAAWLHDVGKAHATRMIDGRCRSPGHERGRHVKTMLR